MTGLAPSPLQLLDPSPVPGYTVYIKRDDLLHPEYGGNKWRKLRYNISEFRKSGAEYLVTFGGPFSNHIAATASICMEEGIKSAAIVRGEYRDPDNPTLAQARARGMQLFHVSKSVYKKKEDDAHINRLMTDLGRVFIVPEGGNNHLGRLGSREIMTELRQQCDLPLSVFVAIGTGTTASGMILESREDDWFYLINSMRNHALAGDIAAHVGDRPNWIVSNDFHRGGFAQVDDSLVHFINEFYLKYRIKLDPVYTGKMMMGLIEMLKNRKPDPERPVVAIHTGGLQGIAAYNYLNKGKGKPLLRL